FRLTNHRNRPSTSMPARAPSAHAQCFCSRRGFCFGGRSSDIAARRGWHACSCSSSVLLNLPLQNGHLYWTSCCSWRVIARTSNTPETPVLPWRCRSLGGPHVGAGVLV